MKVNHIVTQYWGSAFYIWEKSSKKKILSLIMILHGIMELFIWETVHHLEQIISGEESVEF